MFQKHIVFVVAFCSLALLCQSPMTGQEGGASQVQGKTKAESAPKTQNGPPSNGPNINSINRGMSHLLSIKGMQRELEMTEQQTLSLMGSEEGPTLAIRDAFFALSKARDEEDTPEEARAKVVAYQDKVKKILEDEKERLSKILMPEQVERLAQIQLQQLGIHIWKVAEVQEHVGVSDKQLNDIEKVIRDESQAIKDKARTAGRGKTKRENAAIMDEVETMREDLDVKIKDVLSAEQKRLLDQLLGEKFDPNAEENAKKKAEAAKAEAAKARADAANKDK